jgi:Mg-chelatase subunit ChlD
MRDLRKVLANPLLLLACGAIIAGCGGDAYTAGSPSAPAGGRTTFSEGAATSTAAPAAPAAGPALDSGATTASAAGGSARKAPSLSGLDAPAASAAGAPLGAPAGAAGTDAAPPPAAPVAPVAPALAQAPLTAGQIDDNARFPEYLDFLHHYQGPAAQLIPVEQRLFVRVEDGAGHPVAGARVQLFDGSRPVFDGETVSDGRILFLPQAAGAAQAQSLAAIVGRGTQQVEAAVRPGKGEQTIRLDQLPDNSGPVGLDLVFLMDATGSMGDEIDRVKATVDTIASRITQLPGSSPPRLGLVAFRDRGDEYVTRAWDFTDSVPQFQQNLANVVAAGGGDTPESVQAGLNAAIHLPGWADNSHGRRLRLVVLVGDAAPHLDYANDTPYPALLQQAVAAGIKILPIGASGLDPQGEYIFRQFAQVTQGQFVFLTYADGVSGAPGVATENHVSNFSVDQLDSLVVNLVAHEIANQTGQPAQTGAGVVVPAVALPAAPAQPAPPAAAAPDFFARVGAALTGGSMPLWLLLLLPVVVWASRGRAARVRPPAPTAPFAEPVPVSEAPPWYPAAARFNAERTTSLPAALTYAPPLPRDVYVTTTGGPATAPLPALPPEVAARA